METASMQGNGQGGADSATAQETPKDEVCGFLLDSGRLRKADLRRAEVYREQNGGELVNLLVRLGLVSERDVAEAESSLLGLPMVSIADLPDEPPELEALSVRFLKQNLLLPIELTEDELVVVMANPRDEYARKALAMASGRDISPRVGIASEIENGIEKLFGGGRSAMGQIVDSLGGEADDELEDVEHLRDLASEAPVIRLVNLILQRAVEARASDIHIEPFENRLKVRYPRRSSAASRSWPSSTLRNGACPRTAGSCTACRARNWICVYRQCPLPTAKAW
jgi:general secretion pathway protein E